MSFPSLSTRIICRIINLSFHAKGPLSEPGQRRVHLGQAQCLRLSRSSEPHGFLLERLPDTRDPTSNQISNESSYSLLPVLGPLHNFAIHGGRTGWERPPAIDRMLTSYPNKVFVSHHCDRHRKRTTEAEGVCIEAAVDDFNVVRGCSGPSFHHVAAVSTQIP